MDHALAQEAILANANSELLELAFKIGCAKQAFLRHLPDNTETSTIDEAWLRKYALTPLPTGVRPVYGQSELLAILISKKGAKGRQEKAAADHAEAVKLAEEAKAKHNAATMRKRSKGVGA
jgi:hypothetical protein